MIGFKGFVAIVAFIASFQPSFAGKSGRAAAPAAAAPPSGAGAGSAAPSAGAGTGSTTPSAGAGTGSATPSAGAGAGSATPSGAASSNASAGGAGSIKGTASYYTEWSSNAGSCGFIPGKGDLIAAVNAQYMPAKCNQCIQVNYEGKSIKVKATDTCPACDSTKLDLSDNAFAQLAPLDKGILQITWSWVPC